MAHKWYSVNLSKGVSSCFKAYLRDKEIQFEPSEYFDGLTHFEYLATEEQMEAAQKFTDLAEEVEGVAKEIIKEARDCGGKKSYDCELPPPTFERNDVDPWLMVRLILREMDEVETADFSYYGVFGEILFLDVELKTEEAPKPKIVGFIWKIEDDEYGDDAMCFSDEDYKTLMEIAERSKRH